jgi:hypothetical protein
MSRRLLKTDGKGRISLGQAFANMPVQVEEREEGEWTVRIVEAVPARELWLMKNKSALNLVTAGILQAQAHEFAADPRKEREYSWLEDVDEENV